MDELGKDGLHTRQGHNNIFMELPQIFAQSPLWVENEMFMYFYPAVIIVLVCMLVCIILYHSEW